MDGSAHTAYVTNSNVTNGNGGSVSVIDTRSNTVTAAVTVGKTPVGLAVEPAMGSVFVANSGDGTVSVLTAR